MQILVVDDEADVQPLFIQRFRKEIRDGLFDFVFALSGQEALDLLNSLSLKLVSIVKCCLFFIASSTASRKTDCTAK